MSRAGFVTLAGKPNAGKSTLLNRLIGQRLSITSPKPQSTRDRVVGILTRDTDGTPDGTAPGADEPGTASPEPAQLILFDTPGLIEPRDDLQRSMRSAALIALADADVIIYLADAMAGQPPSLEVAAGLSTSPRAPVILALNKSDILPPGRAAITSEPADGSRHAATYLISAATGDGVSALLDAVTAMLPESPFLYPADDVSTQPLRFFASELIRETAFEQLEQELPYSLAAQIEEFREEQSPVYIRAILYVERDSQQGILIGHKGARIREIGRAARIKI
jgi:GTPase